jgi:hypothetical protein
MVKCLLELLDGELPDELAPLDEQAARATASPAMGARASARGQERLDL